MQPVEREQAVIRLILLMRRNGGSYQAIQAELNRLGIPGPGRSGAGPHGRWTSHERVRQIILRAENGTWPPLPAEHDPNQLQLDQAVTGT